MASPSAPLLSPSPPPVYGIPVPQDYILLRRRRRPRSCRCCAALLSSSTLLLLTLLLTLSFLALFFLFPSNPTISIARIRLDRLHISAPSITFSLGLDLVVRNRDFFSLDYDQIKLVLGYRGQSLGEVVSGGGRIRARGVSHVDADLKVDGVNVIGEIFYLVQDLATGTVPFDTVTEVNGRLHLFFIQVPVQGRLSCAVHVNAENQTVVRQNCYPE